MSQNDVVMLQRGVDAFKHSRPRHVLRVLPPDVVHRNRADEPEVREYHGLEEMKGYALSWLQAFDGLRIVVGEWIDLEDQVIEVAELQGIGRATGAPVEGTYVFLWTLRDGRIVEGREYASREEAIEVAESRRPEPSA